MKSNHVKQALDNTLSSLRVTGPDAERFLALAKEERKGKRSLHVVLVMVIIMLLAAVTASAILFSWKDAGRYLKKENKEGLFIIWSQEEQIKLVASLIRDHLIDDNEDTIKFLGLIDKKENPEDIGNLAQKIMEDWLSMPFELVSFRSIMERNWGEFQTWDVEKKAWYTQMLSEADMLSPDMERFVLPGSEHIPQAVAERIAKPWASLWMNIPMTELSHYRIDAEFVIFPKPQVIDGQETYTTENMKPEWVIIFEPYDNKQDAQQVIVFVDSERGIVDIHQMAQTLQIRHYGQSWPQLARDTEQYIREQAYKPFMEWSAEAKAAWSAKYRSSILREDKGVLDYVTAALAHFNYGLPEVGSIDEHEAVAIARQVVAEMDGYNDKAFSQYDITYAYFDITDPQQHKWRVQFTASGLAMDKITNGKPEGFLIYVVEVDALTGNVTDAMHFSIGESVGYDGIIKLL